MKKQKLINKVIDIICRTRNLFGNGVDVPDNGWTPDWIADSIIHYCETYKIQVELALAQAYVECHFGLNPAAKRSRRTRNMFNVGNVDSGADRSFPTWNAGIKAYCELMRREYNWNEDEYITIESMVRHDFARPRGGRYATAPSYTNTVYQTALSFRNELYAPAPSTGEA